MPIFFGTAKEDTISTQKTLEKWAGNSLSQMVKLGWVYFPEDDEKFEMLPAFQRIEIIYRDLIYNIDSIKTTYDFQN